MRWLAGVVLARPWITIGAWLVVVVVLAVSGLSGRDHLADGGYDIPGSQSEKAASVDRQAFGNNELVPVVLQGSGTLIDRSGPKLVADLRRRWSVLSPWDKERQVARRSGAPAALILVDLTWPASAHRATARLAPLRRMIAADVPASIRVRLSGNTVGAGAFSEAWSRAASSAEKVAFPVLVLVLLVVFGSPIAAAIPAAVGLTTVAASTGVIVLLAGAINVTEGAISIATMMGLALGVDYSLLIVSRFREELVAQDSVQAAAQTATEEAGGTVLMAGVVLLAAMGLALALSPGSVMVSIAGAVVVAVAVSLLSAMTMVPAVLAIAGKQIDRWRIFDRSSRSPLPLRIADAAMARPLQSALAAFVGVLALGLPALAIASRPPNLLQLPGDNQARIDYQALNRLFGPGYSTPYEIVVRAPSDTEVEHETRGLERALAREPGVSAAIGPSGAGQAAGVFAGGTGARHSWRVYAIPRRFAGDASARLHDQIVRRVAVFSRATGHEALVGGLGAQFVDFQRGASGFLPELIVALSAVSFLLLAVLLRAIVLPAVAVTLNLVVVGAAFGGLRLLFQGADPLLGGPGFVDVVSVAAILAILFALSVDYEVFLLTRMREGWASGLGAREAIAYGIGRTAGVVTGAALIMAAVFLAFASSSFITPRQFGVGLALAVTLDALVLRLFLLPAVMALLGRASWWLPRRRT
jgi:RND superfamily putative drug exporter